MARKLPRRSPPSMRPARGYAMADTALEDRVDRINRRRDERRFRSVETSAKKPRDIPIGRSSRACRHAVQSHSMTMVATGMLSRIPEPLRKRILAHATTARNFIALRVPIESLEEIRSAKLAHLARRWRSSGGGRENVPAAARRRSLAGLSFLPRRCRRVTRHSQPFAHPPPRPSSRPRRRTARMRSSGA